MSFEEKTIEQPARVCLRLKAEREKKGISASALAEQLRMSTKHIHAIESCNFEALPFSTVYQKKLLTKYVEALGLPALPYVQQFEQEELPEPQDHIPAPQKVSRLQSLHVPLLAKIASLFCVLLVVGGYLFSQINHIIEPPELLVFTPEQDMTTTDTTLEVKGKTVKEALVLINGRAVQGSEDGFFSEPIVLTEGVNTITLIAKKKYGKETRQIRHVVLKPDTQVSFGDGVALPTSF